MAVRPKIFVMVSSVSRNDAVVDDIYLKSTFPERIYTVLSHAPQADSLRAFSDRGVGEENIRIPQAGDKKITNFRLPLSNLQNFWKGEEYVMVVDGGLRLEKGWDEELISMIRKAHSRKSVITSNPLYFAPEGEFAESDVVAIGASEIGKDMLPVFVPVAKERHSLGGKLFRGMFCHTGFIFALGNILEEVPFDPYFDGAYQDVAISARLWSKGWSVFHPDENVVLPAGKKSGQGGAKKSKPDSDSAARLKALFGIEGGKNAEAARDIKEYGLGHARSIQNFYSVSGLDFPSGRVGKSAKDANFPFAHKIIGAEAIENAKKNLIKAKVILDPELEPKVFIKTDDLIVVDNFINQDLMDSLLVFLGNIPLSLPVTEGGLIPNWLNMKDGLPLKGAMNFEFAGNTKQKPEEKKDDKPKPETVDESYTSPVILRFANRLNEVAETLESQLGVIKKDWKKFTIEHFVYSVGAGKTFDTSEYVNYFPSFEFCLTEKWDSSWGASIMTNLDMAEVEPRGALDVNTGFRNAGSGIWIQPKPNRMIFFGRKCSHMISKVTPNAGDNTISFLSGVFR